MDKWKLTSLLPVTYEGDFSFEKCGANATAYKDDKVTQSKTPVCASKKLVRLVCSRLSHLRPKYTSSHNTIDTLYVTNQPTTSWQLQLGRCLTEAFVGQKTINSFHWYYIHTYVYDILGSSL